MLYLFHTWTFWCIVGALFLLYGWLFWDARTAPEDPEDIEPPTADEGIMSDILSPTFDPKCTKIILQKEQ